MKYTTIGGLFLFAASICGLAGPAKYSGPAVRPSPSTKMVRPKLPVIFEQNVGQTAEQVQAIARGRGFILFLQGSESLVKLPGGNLRMAMGGGNSKAKWEVQDRLPGVSNYFIGNQPSLWRRRIPQFAEARQRNVYPGIDLVFHGEQGSLEYDFVVQPNADPSRIQVTYPGAEKVTIADNGDVLIGLAGGNVQQKKPLVYQQVGENRIPVSCDYRIGSGQKVTLALGSYNHARPLVIDPVFSFDALSGATFGSSGDDRAYNITVDPSTGNALVSGKTQGSDFPAAVNSPSGGTDTFITKLDPSLTQVLVSTYFGGSNNESANAVAIGSTGKVFVTGYTRSSDLPVVNCSQCSYGGATGGVGASGQGTGNVLTPRSGDSGSDAGDVFVLQMPNTLDNVDFADYMGGPGSESATGIAVDTSGNFLVTGYTTGGVPFANNHYKGGASDGFLAKYNVNHQFQWFTYFGGSGFDEGYSVALPANGSASSFITVSGSTNSTDIQALNGGNAGGMDALVGQFTPSGSQVFLHYVGGTADDFGTGVAVGTDGTIYLTGATASYDFVQGMNLTNQLTPNGNLDAFVVALNPTSAAVIYAYIIGGLNNDIGQEIAVDPFGDAYMAGVTTSLDFPNPYTDTFQVGAISAFLVKLDRQGKRNLFGTYVTPTVGRSTPIITVRSGKLPTGETRMFVVGTTANVTTFGNPGPNGTGFQGLGISAGDAFAARVKTTDVAILNASQVSSQAVPKSGAERLAATEADTTVPVTSAAPGGTVTVTAQLLNQLGAIDPTPASAVQVNGTLTPGLILQNCLYQGGGGSGASGSCKGAGNTISISGGTAVSLAPGQSLNLTITAQVAANATPGSNLAVMLSSASHTDDSDPYNNLDVPIGNITVCPTTGCGQVSADLSSPAPGSTLTSTTQTFSWAAIPVASGYWLDVGTSPGQGNLSAGFQTGTSRTVSGLPTSGPLYVQLFTKVGSTYLTVRQYTFTMSVPTATCDVTLGTTAQHSVLPGSTATFCWPAISGAGAYWLDVGNTGVGNGNLSAGKQTATSRTVTNLPTDGEPIYVRLWQYQNNVPSIVADYVFNSSGSATCDVTLGTTPAQTVLPGAAVTICWPAISGASAYWLDVGNTGVGNGNLSAGKQTSTNRTVTNLPVDGEPIYVRLWQYQNNVPSIVADYVFTSAGSVVCGITLGTTPQLANFPGSTTTICWPPFTGANAYWLDVGKNGVGQGDISAGKQTTTSRTVTNLPVNGQPLYVRLWQYQNNVPSVVADYQFRAAPATCDVTLGTTAAGSTLPSGTATICWPSISGAEAYWLDVGVTGVGQGDLSAYKQVATSRTVTNLPSGGRTVYVRLWKYVSGTPSVVQDYTFRTP